MSSDLTQSGPTLVFDLINSANPDLPNGPLSPSNTSLGTPTATGLTPNTSITISAINGEGYTGAEDVSYNRIDIGAMFSSWGVTATLDNAASFTNASDLLPALNSQYHLDLQASDIDDAAIGAGSYPFNYTLMISAGSLTYIGELVVTLNQAS